MYPFGQSGPFVWVLLLLVVGQGRGQSPVKKVRQRAAYLPPGSTSAAATAGRQPDMVDSFGFREFILRAGNDRIVAFPDGGPQATLAQIVPTDMMKARKRRMADLTSQRGKTGEYDAVIGRDRSLVGADEDSMEASAMDNGRSRQMEPAKLGTVAVEVHPSRTTLTFPIRGLPGISTATVAVVDLYPVTRAPFPVICRGGTGTVILGEMSAAEQLDPVAQPKIYTADVTACLRAAREAGLDEIRIEMALPCRQRCLLPEAPFLVLQ